MPSYCSACRPEYPPIRSHGSGQALLHHITASLVAAVDGQAEDIDSAQLPGVVNLYVRPHLGHIRLARLTPEDVEKMGRVLAESGKSGNTQRLARTILRRALGQAERRDYVARNVVALTDAPAVKVDERPVLTPEQAKQLFDALHDDRLLPSYVVAIHTGLRQGELLALRWSDVDLGAGTLTVTGTLDRKIRQRTDPKTDKSRRAVPLTPQAMEALQVHQVRQNLEGTQGSDVATV